MSHMRGYASRGVGATSRGMKMFKRMKSPHCVFIFYYYCFCFNILTFIQCGILFYFQVENKDFHPFIQNLIKT